MVHQVVPAGYVNLTPHPVGVPDVVEGGLYDAVFRNAPAARSGYDWVSGVVFNDANGNGLRDIFSEVEQCQGLPICDDPGDGFVWLRGYVYRDVDAVLNAPDGLKGAADVGLAAVPVTATAGTWTASGATDASGFYSLQMPAGPGQVTVALPAGYIALTPPTVSYDASNNVHTFRVDFAVISATECASDGVVHGYVYSDTNSDGVFVLGTDTPTLGEATVGYGGQTQRTNWAYAFACVPAGAGTVTSTNPAGYVNTTPNSVNVTVPAGGLTSANFGKAFAQIPLALRYAYIPIVYWPGP